MKTKKSLKIFLIIITISLILSSIFDITTYQNRNMILLKNIEALAEGETTIDKEILPICSAAKGLCIYKGTKYIGVHYKDD